MANLPALEALPFPHTFHAFLWSVFLQLYEIYFHCIRILSGPGSGGRLRLETVVTSPPLKFINTEFVTMEGLGLFYPFLKSVQWGGHGYNHGGDLSVEAHGKVSDGGELVLKLSFGGYIFKFVDILLESIIRGSILVLAWFLKELGYVTASFHFGVKEIQILVVVCHKFLECLFFGFDAGVGHFVIPFLGDSDSFLSAHFAKDEGYLELIRGINSWVDGEVHLHCFEPL